MANIIEWNEDQQKVWNDWANSRPENVKQIALKFPPNKLYRMKSTGNRVTLYSYSEDETITVNVTGKYNLISFERRVFGIKPEDLEECDLPSKEELLGTTLNKKETLEFINSERAKNGLPPMDSLKNA